MNDVIEVPRKKKNAIFELYKNNGAKNVKIIRQIDSKGIFYLVGFEHHGCDLRSICSFEESEEYAIVLETTISKYEESMLEDWNAEYGGIKEEEYEEPEITEVKEEYEIKSDLEDSHPFLAGRMNIGYLG